jgi:hypothetical protein
MVGIVMRPSDIATGRVACATTFYAEVTHYANTWFSPEHA